MGLLDRLRDRRTRDRIPTELFVPAPAFPAYQSEPLIPDFLPEPLAPDVRPEPPATAIRPRNQRATGYHDRHGN